MTRAAESNAIFGRSIHLYIIYMMDVLSTSFTDNTRVVVSLSNCVLKFFVKCNRIWFKRFSSQPARIFFTCDIKNFTNPVAFFRTVMPSFFMALFHRKIYSAHAALLGNVSTCPAWIRLLSYCLRFPYLYTLSRTTFSSLKAARISIETFVTNNTLFYKHTSPEKGASRFASQYRCLVDTGKTGCV